MNVLSPEQCICDELRNYNAAALNHAQAYHSFLTLAQMGDWESAARSQLHAVTMIELAMDAYMRACRIRSVLEGQEDEHLPD